MRQPWIFYSAIVVMGIVIAFKADNQTAKLGIVAAQGGGWLQHEPGVGELGQNRVPQGQRLFLGKAMGDSQNAAIPAPPLPRGIRMRAGSSSRIREDSQRIAPCGRVAAR